MNYFHKISEYLEKNSDKKNIIFLDKKSGLFIEASNSLEELPKSLEMYKDKERFLLIKGYITETKKSVIQLETLDLTTNESLNLFLTEFQTYNWQDKSLAIMNKPTPKNDREKITASLLAYYILRACLKDSLEIPTWCISTEFILEEEVNMIKHGDPDILGEYFNLKVNLGNFRRV